jgi:thiamine-phosphate pyrophosphorylase
MKTPLLCYVTDRMALSPEADQLAQLLACIERAARAGVDWIQLREKDLEARPLYDLVRKAVGICSAVKPNAPARVLVNDRLDVAWAAHAAGVHLGENSLPVSEIVRWRNLAHPSDFLVGTSCHSLEAAARAAEAGADYVCFGPVFATPSKVQYGAPQGLRKLAQVCAAVSVPVVAIGGITAENAPSCFQAGAAGIAAIRLFQNARNLDAALRGIGR